MDGGVDHLNLTTKRHFGNWMVEQTEQHMRNFLRSADDLPTNAFLDMLNQDQREVLKESNRKGLLG
jgi:hypothetical protein